MPYIDEEILEAKRKQEHQKYTTLETGMYAGDELITFAQIEIPDTKISLFLPEQFVLMPEEVKRVKYPSQDAPDYIFTSLDSTVNICINVLPILLKRARLYPFLRCSPRWAGCGLRRQFFNVLTNFRALGVDFATRCTWLGNACVVIIIFISISVPIRRGFLYR